MEISQITKILEHNLLVYLSVSRYINDHMFRLSRNEIDDLKQYLLCNSKRIDENKYIFVMYEIPLILTIEYSIVIRMSKYKF